MYAKSFMHSLHSSTDRAPMLFLLYSYKSIRTLFFYYGKVFKHAHPITSFVTLIETLEAETRIAIAFKAISILF